jgi:membrane protease YdiL (CAAX protease family)
VTTLLKRYLIWRVSWRWYLVAFLLYPAIFVAGIALHAAWTGTPADFSTTLAWQFFAGAARLPLFVLPFFLFDALSNGEEMGWRGYVLPRLQARHSALAASLTVGVIWGFWHLPKFLGPANSGDFGLFVVKTMGDAVLYTWLYNNTRGSLLLVTILHAAGNTAGFFLPLGHTAATDSVSAQIITVALIWLAAALVTVHAGPAQLSRTEPRQVQAECL